MAIMANISQGFQITKKSWFSQFVYSIVFWTIFSLIIVPFAFLVAIGAVLRNDLIYTNLFDDFIANPFFWIAIYILMTLSLVFVSMSIGVIQLIGSNKSKNETIPLEEYLKFPFKNGRFIPFLVLAFIESIILAIIGIILNVVSDFLGLNTISEATTLNEIINNILTIESLTSMAISIVLFFILIPPFIIASFAIIHDKAKYDAFIVGWKTYFNSFVDVLGVTIISVIPSGVIIFLITLCGFGIAGIAPTSGASDIAATTLATILGFSFVIIILSLIMLVFLFPFFCNSMGLSYENAQNAT